MPTKPNNESDTSMRPTDKLRFCADLMRKQIDLVRQVETRANIVVGLSGASIAFAINKVGSANTTWIPVLISSSTLAIIFALMAFKPPKLFSRHGQTSTVFYHTYITKFSQKSFIKEIKRVTTDIDTTVEQYATETYNIVKYSLQYKKMFAHLAITIFTLGLFATVVVWIIWSAKIKIGK